MNQYLYKQLEKALVSDGGTLQQLRELFIVREIRPTRVFFNPVYITVDSISPTNCNTVCPWCSSAFCNVSDHEWSLSENRVLPTAQWELCSKDHSLNFFWSTTSIKSVDLMNELAKQVVSLYGNGLSMTLLAAEFDYNVDESQLSVKQTLHLSIKSLACMPDMNDLKGALRELLTWVIITQS